MDERQSGVRSFRDLIVWQRAMQLCMAVYELTGEFPREELYGITSQIRRAVVSILSNIAEGHGRNSPAQLIHFLSMARGSTFEVQAQLLISRELRFGKPMALERCDGLCDEVSRMLYSTLNSLRIQEERRRGTKDEGREIRNESTEGDLHES
jgi:four helix bundle protein